MLKYTNMYKLNEYIVSSKDAIKKQSTNSASKGWLLKWKIGNTWLKSPGYLYNYMYESYSEVLASAVAKDLGIKRCLQYKPCILIIDGVRVLGCESQDYKGNNIEITLNKLEKLGEIGCYKQSGYKGYKSLIKEIKQKFNINIQSYLEDTILLDAVILNTDRNLWNLSIITDGEGKFSECVIYDSGSSFGLDGLHSGVFDEKYMYSNGFKAEPFDIYFENQVRYIRNSREYNTQFKNSLMVYRYFMQLSLDNTYNIVNPLTKEQLQFIDTLLHQRFSSIIVNKLWKQNI